MSSNMPSKKQAALIKAAIDVGHTTVYAPLATLNSMQSKGLVVNVRPATSCSLRAGWVADLAPSFVVNNPTASSV
jgi:hypothetical protein